MTKRSLLLVFALALLVRLAFLVELSGEPLFEVLLGDALRFDAWAREIAGGDWLGSEVFYQAPLYPYVMAAVYRIAGAETFAVRLLQAALGAFSCALLAAASGRIFDRRVGVWAGCIAALYSPWIWVDGLIQKTSLALFLTALLVYVLARSLGEQRAKWSLTAGIALGLLALVRENALVLVVPLGIWFARRGSTEPREGTTGRSLLFLALGVLVVLVPVGLRNATLGGVFLPTASNAGVNFYLGNGASADGLYTPLVRGQGHPDYESADARELAQRETGEELTPGEVSAFWLRCAVDEITDEPLRWLRLLVRKALLTLNAVEIMDSEALEEYRRHSVVLSWLRVTTFGVLLPLAVFGLLARRMEAGRLEILATPPLFLAASIVVFFVNARFRMGMVPFLVPLAARGLVELGRVLREPRHLREVRLALLLALGATLLAHLPPRLRGDPRSTTQSNLSAAYLRRGDLERAYELGNQAVELDASNADALFNRALAAKGLGRLEPAERDLRAAMDLEPAYAADALAELGALRAMQEEYEEALALLQQALDLDPHHGLAHYYRGLVLRNLNRLDEAAEAFQRAIEEQPALVYAHNDLGWLRELQGRWREAAEHYRDALAIDPVFSPSREALDRLGDEHPELEAP